MWNDKETDLDLIGTKRIAQTIISIMNEQELRPLTIGVYGSWGVGKSSVLKLVENQVLKDEDTLIITFNAWLFQGYEDTRSALMETVVSKIVHLQPLNKKILRLGKSLFKRINWLKVAKTAGSFALNTVMGMPTTTLWGIPGVVKGAKDFFSSKEEKDKDGKEDKDDESFLKEDEESVPGQIHAFRKELKELIENSKVSRIVVLVDELDRCLPNSVIDILEAIRLFLFVEGTVFILAADEQMVEYAVRKHFPDLPVSQSDYTKHYLEKLVQIPFRVPSLNQLQSKNYVRFLLLQHELKSDKAKLEEICSAFDKSKITPYDNRDITYDFVKGYFEESGDNLKSTMLVADQLGAILAVELRGNPRNIKRFLNSIFLRLRIAEIYEIANKVQLDMLSKLMILERFHTSVYEVLIEQSGSSKTGNSDLIDKLENTQNSREFKKIIEDADLKTVGEKEITQLEDWAKLKPTFKGVDLRPYVFVSSEKSIIVVSSDELPVVLKPLFDKLASGSKISIAAEKDEIENLTDTQIYLIFSELANLCKSSSDWSKTDGPMDGIIYLVRAKPVLEIKFIELLELIPAKQLKVWAVSNLAGFKSTDGIAARALFYDRIKNNPEVSKTIKSYVTQS